MRAASAACREAKAAYLAYLACRACQVCRAFLASHRSLALRCRTTRPLPARTEVYEGVVQDLIDELGQLPGVGPKGAQRIAFHLLTADPEDVRRLAATLIEVTEKVKFCRTCGNVAENDECRICMDARRDPSVICVVEEPKDVAAIEKIREFRGGITCSAARSARWTVSVQRT